jgi:ribosomal protein L13
MYYLLTKYHGATIIVVARCLLQVQFHFLLTYPGDYGDHVVVINSEHIALKADEWYYRVYFHHTGYPGGASWTKAWEVHKKNPTMVSLPIPPVDWNHKFNRAYFYEHLLKYRL